MGKFFQLCFAVLMVVPGILGIPLISEKACRYLTYQCCHLNLENACTALTSCSIYALRLLDEDPVERLCLVSTMLKPSNTQRQELNKIMKIFPFDGSFEEPPGPKEEPSDLVAGTDTEPTVKDVLDKTTPPTVKSYFNDEGAIKYDFVDKREPPTVKSDFYDRSKPPTVKSDFYERSKPPTVKSDFYDRSEPTTVKNDSYDRSEPPTVKSYFDDQAYKSIEPILKKVTVLIKLLMKENIHSMANLKDSSGFLYNNPKVLGPVPLIIYDDTVEAMKQVQKNFMETPLQSSNRFGDSQEDSFHDLEDLDKNMNKPKRSYFMWGIKTFFQPLESLFNLVMSAFKSLNDKLFRLERKDASVPMLSDFSRDKDECATCMMTMEKNKDVLASKILELVKGLCTDLPKRMRGECGEFVITIGKPIVNDMLERLPFRKMCIEMGFCAEEESDVHMKPMLESPTADIDEVDNNLCFHLPEEDRQRCVEKMKFPF